MNRLLVSAAVVAAAVLASPANAYTVKGSVSCPDIVTEHQNESYRAMNRWWLLGYFTARNYVDNVDVGYQVDEEDVYALAYQFCQNNPGNDWDDAAINTYDSMK